MKTLHIIFNVSARSGKTRKLWRELKGILKEREIDFKAYRTLREGHATQIARELSLLADEAVYIAVLGGDGTPCGPDRRFVIFEQCVRDSKVEDIFLSATFDRGKA